MMWAKLRTLIETPDGTLSLTKLAALAAHVSMWAAFNWITYHAGFLWDLWIIYGSISIFHAIVDKSGNQFKDFKEKQLDAAVDVTPAPN